MMPSKYQHLPTSSGVIIHFYGDLDPLFIPCADLPLSVEDICERCGHYLSKYLPHGSEGEKDDVCHMSSLMLPMFSLIDLDHKVWMSSREKLTNQDDQYQFYFRIRFCIFASNLSLLRKLDHQTWEYLFLQVQDDFLKDRLNTMYSKQLERSKLLGFVVVAYFIPRLSQLQQDQVTVTNPSVTFFGLKKHLPQNERLNFKWQWSYFRLYRSVKEEVSKYSETLGNNGVLKFKHTYINGILEEVGKYGSEMYAATELQTTKNGVVKEPTDIVVDPFFSRPSGIYFGTNFVCQFPEVENLALHTFDNQEYGARVQIVHKNGIPKIVCFKEAKMAESFVSCVDGYCRLLCNFYYSLSTPVLVEPPSLMLLKELRAFGPMLNKDAVDELQKEMSALKDDTVNENSACFLIHQSVHSLYDFVIVKLTDRDDTATHTKLHYDRKKQSFKSTLEDLGDVDCSSIQLLRELKKKGRMIRPKNECSLSEVFKSDKLYYYYQETPAKGSATKTAEPKLFPETAVDSTGIKLLVNGKFTRVSLATLDNQDRQEGDEIKVAIKQLSQGHENYSDDFQNGMWKLMTLQSSKTFVRFYGYMVKAPFRVLVEYCPLGDLHQVMTQCPRLNLPQVMSVVEQLTHGLSAMDEKKEVHGNLRCRNILVVQIRSNDLLVKISDPGLETMYNSRILIDDLNIERLPWVAVERFEDLTNVTLMSEIYAFATTCWEMLSKGAHPNQAVQHLSAPEKIAFYRHGERPPRPESLKVTTNDDNYAEAKNKIWQLMEDCWQTDPENRPSIKDISRSVFTLCDIVGDQVDDQISEEAWNEHCRKFQEHLLQSVGHQDTPGCLAQGSTFGTKIVISPERLEIEESESGKLGEGYYGSVWKGKLYEPSAKVGQQSTRPPKIVAVKKLKKIDADQKLEFLKEIDIASSLSHENIVKVLGVCCVPHQQLVMEFAEKGSITKYLQGLRKEPHKDTLARFCLDVAEGMTYLHSKNVVHRDLAARNVLLSKMLQAKITDFGLAKILGAKDYYKGRTDKEIPAHWCSPEAMQFRRFSKKGDVWSYGVFMWEIFNLGKKKPHLVPSDQIQNLVNKLATGARLPKPSHCPSGFYEHMKEDCWQLDPQKRPDFQSLKLKVLQLTQNIE